MLGLQSPRILSVYASHRATELRNARRRTRRGVLPTELRQWLGEQLVRIGAWIASEPTARHAPEAA